MKVTLFNSLKHLAVIGVLLFFEPFVMLVHGKLYEGSTDPLIGVGLIIAAGYIGYLIHKINIRLYRRFNKALSILITLVDIGGIGVGLILAVIILYKGSLWSILAMIGITLWIYYVGINMMELEYNEVYYKGLCSVLIALGIICTLIVKIPSYTIIFAYNVVIYCLIQNQGIIDELLERTKKNVPVIGTIRNYNIKLMSVIMLVLSGGYLLKDYIASGLYLLVELMRRGLVSIINYIASLGSNSEVVHEMPSEGPLENPFLAGGETAEANKIWDMIGYIFAIVIIVIIAALIIFALCKFIKKAIAVIKIWINRLLTVKEEVVIADEYYDQIESIGKVKSEDKHRNPKSAIRAWKKRVALWEQYEDNSEKLKIGYKLILDWLKIKQVPITLADTPNEICEKAICYEKVKDLEQETQGYNQVKYGEQQADRQVVELIRTTLQGLKDDV